jgi:AcrR family transcriptional regulator
VNARAIKAEPPEPRPTHDLILDAAERLFAERGFAGVAVREIAAEAGLKNQASLYHHFRNKRAIYEAVLSRGVKSLAALITGNGESAPVRLSPGDLVARVLDYLAEHPALPRLIQRASLDDSRYLFRAASRLLTPLYTQGLQLLADTRGPWQPEDFPFVAAGFYHLIFGYFANAALLETVLQEDPRSAHAVARQREFLKAAAERLLRTDPPPSPAG